MFFWISIPFPLQMDTMQCITWKWLKSSRWFFVSYNITFIIILEFTLITAWWTWSRHIHNYKTYTKLLLIYTWIPLIWRCYTLMIILWSAWGAKFVLFLFYYSINALQCQHWRSTATCTAALELHNLNYVHGELTLELKSKDK